MDEEKKTEEKPTGTEEINKVIEELKSAADKLTKPEEKAPPAAPAPDRRAALQKALGYTDEQMAAHEEMIMRTQAPVIEQTAWASLEKKSDLQELRPEIEKELRLYPQERRTPELLSKIYWMVKGQKADSKPSTPASKPGVERTRVSAGPGYTGNEPGLTANSGEKDQGANEEFDEREKFVADKLGISAKDYAKSRNVGRGIRELKLPDERPAQSLADVELKRMTTTRR